MMVIDYLASLMRRGYIMILCSIKEGIPACERSSGGPSWPLRCLYACLAWLALAALALAVGWAAALVAALAGALVALVVLVLGVVVLAVLAVAAWGLVEAAWAALRRAIT
jgi:hypothetical protein